MRTLLVFLVCTAALRADFSYRNRVQITGGELYDALGALSSHGRDPVTTTRLIKGYRMAVLERHRTTVTDVNAGTITTIDYARKTYSVRPLSEMKKFLEEAEGKVPREDSFKVENHAPSSSAAPIGMINVSPIAFTIAGSSGNLNVTVDSWIGTVPGYEQIGGWIGRLAAKMGSRTAFVYASGFADQALRAPESLQGFDEAERQLAQVKGAAFQTKITISGTDRKIAEATIELSDFGGGVQDATKFDPPANFKKVDPPSLP